VGLFRAHLEHESGLAIYTTLWGTTIAVLQQYEAGKRRNVRLLELNHQRSTLIRRATAIRHQALRAYGRVER